MVRISKVCRKAGTKEKRTGQEGKEERYPAR
jgi:hypothetical protein